MYPTRAPPPPSHASRPTQHKNDLGAIDLFGSTSFIGNKHKPGPISSPPSSKGETARIRQQQREDENNLRHAREFFQELDQRPWTEKLLYVLEMAQPFENRRGGFAGPAFPYATIPDTRVAGQQIVAAANAMVALWAPGDLARKHGRSRRAVKEWRDILTHPETYRRLFGEWVGYVYVDRSAVEETALDAEDQSRSGPTDTHPAPSWTQTTNTRDRGVGSVGLYTHGFPERFGHQVHLVPAATSALATQYREDVDMAQHDRLGRGFEPEMVVRLKDLGWYLAGFLGSVLVWTHLAHTQVGLIGTVQADTPIDVGFDVDALLESAEIVLDPSLYQTWGALRRYLSLCRCDLLLPIPDMIRVPQEWCAAMSASRRGETPHDSVYWRGLSGEDRRRSLGLPPRDTGVPDWLKQLQLVRPYLAKALHDACPERGFEKDDDNNDNDIDIVTQWELLFPHLQQLQDQHQTLVFHARNRGWVTGHRMALTERYVPMPEPPHPVTGLFIPWTTLSKTSNGGSTHREQVIRLGSVGVMRLEWLGIPCLETGLAIEAWGYTWSETQRKERLAVLKLAPAQIHKKLVTAVMGGQSVPYYDDPPYKRFIGRNVMVLDEEGPMGTGYRLYNTEDQSYLATIGVDAHDMEDWWFRIDKMRVVERLSLEGPPPDERGRWEDSGIEIPSRLEREVPGLDRPLTTLWLLPLPAPTDRRTLDEWMMRSQIGTISPAPRKEDKAIAVYLWEQALGRAGRRVWAPERISPWPVSFAVDGASFTSSMDLEPLATAHVIRDLRMQRVAVPDPQWLQNVLAMPPTVSTDGNQDLNLNMAQWKQKVLDSGLPFMSLSPMARRTLVSLSFDRVSYTAMHAQYIPVVGLPSMLLPGIPALLRPPEVAKSAFRHYPNLTLVSLHDNGLVDIPRGLLDWLSEAAWRQSPYAAPPGGRSAIPLKRTSYWDLSQNNIRDLSDNTLKVMVWIVLHGLLAAEATKGHRRRTHARINLWGNPILKQPGINHFSREVRDEHTGKVIGVQVRMSSKDYVRRRLDGLDLGFLQSWFKRLPGTASITVDMNLISHNISNMMDAVRPSRFQREMMEERRKFDRHQYRWMI